MSAKSETRASFAPGDAVGRKPAARIGRAKHQIGGPGVLSATGLFRIGCAEQNLFDPVAIQVADKVDRPPRIVERIRARDRGRRFGAGLDILQIDPAPTRLIWRAGLFGCRGAKKFRSGWGFETSQLYRTAFRTPGGQVRTGAPCTL